MDFCTWQGANHSNSSTIARICNAAMGKKTRFYVPDSVRHHTSVMPACFAALASKVTVLTQPALLAERSIRQSAKSDFPNLKTLSARTIWSAYTWPWETKEIQARCSAKAYRASSLVVGDAGRRPEPQCLTPPTGKVCCKGSPARDSAGCPEGTQRDADQERGISCPSLNRRQPDTLRLDRPGTPRSRRRVRDVRLSPPH